MPRSDTKMAVYEGTMCIKSYEVAVVVVHVLGMGVLVFDGKFISWILFLRSESNRKKVIIKSTQKKLAIYIFP